MKRILLSALICATILTGCNGSVLKISSENSSEDRNSNINIMALVYMEDKYGEKFEYLSPYGDSMSGTHHLLAKSESFPGQGILVEIKNYKEDYREFSDNYLAVKYHKELIGFIQDGANQIFGEAIVYNKVANEAMPDLPVDATFEDYLADTSVWLAIMVEVKESKYVSEEQAEKLAERLSIHGTFFYASLVIVRDSEYGTFDNATLEKYASMEKYVRFASIEKLDENTRIKWQ